MELAEGIGTSPAGGGCAGDRCAPPAVTASFLAVANRSRAASAWRTIALVVGIVAHLAVGIFYLAIGLVVPWPVIPLLWAVWVFLLVMAVKRRERPAWVLATPIVAAAILFTVVSVGEAVFGWTA